MNVWIYVVTNVATEHVLGPFTSVTLEDDTLVDGLTGTTIMHRVDGDWMLNIHSSVIVVRRIVIQQGGWDSPWGERGRSA